MSDPIAAIRKRVAAWGREDSRILLAEIDRLRAVEALLDELVAAFHATDPGVWPGIIDGAAPSCFGCRPVYRYGGTPVHTAGCPIARAMAYVAAKNTTTGEG